MEVKIVKASIDQKIILRHLLELYRYDSSEFDKEDVNNHGIYGYKYLDNYWTETDERFAFLVKVNENYAGFALVRKINKNGEFTEFYYSMAEFFVMKKYRKNGIGRRVAFQIFDLLSGEWVVGQVEENIPAQKFWRKIVTEYTNDSYKEIQKDDWEGPIQTFFSGKKKL